MNARCLRWTVLLVLLLPPLRTSAADSLDDVDKLARDWVKLRVETTRLETAWKSECELVESTVAALNERAALAEEQRDLTKAKTAKDRDELDALRAKIQGANDDLKLFETRLQALTTKLIAMRPNLPPRLSDALEMSYRSLASAELSPGERMQLAMTVLNRCAQFNRLVTVGDDVLVLGGEPSAKSFEVIYWGLSHGYAVDRATHKTWLGSPGVSGWNWEPKPEAFENVVQLLAIARDRADPAFVVVPATVGRALAEPTRKGEP